MASFERPKCPYCKKKVDFMTAWMLRRQGEYRCPRCRGISTIVLDMKLSFFAVGTVITSLMIFFILRVILQRVSLWNILWLMIPFVVFYILSLFLVRLKKPVVKKVPKKRNMAGKRSLNGMNDNWQTQQDMEQTKIR